jgi:hypothetical protein
MSIKEGVRPLRLLVLKRDDHWVAQCLEFDICAQARTQSGLWEAFSRQLFDHVKHAVKNKITGFRDHPEAPMWAFEAYDNGFQFPEGVTPVTMAPRFDWETFFRSFESDVEEQGRAMLAQMVPAVASVG